MTRHKEDRTPHPRCRGLLVLGSTCLMALSGCQSAAQSPSATVGHTPTPMFESGSRMYRECTATAGDDTQAQERCLGEELAYQQRSLDALYQQWADKLDSAERSVLQEEHDAWHRENDQLCGPESGASPIRKACRLKRMTARYSVLNYRLSDASPGHWTEDTPDAKGAMIVRLGDAMIAMQSDGCSIGRTGNLICRNARLSVSTRELRQQPLTLPEIWFPWTCPQNSPKTTGFRGSLHAGFAEGWYSIMLSDIDMDGHEDLMAWTGRDGTYGDPSYTYFLYDRKAKRLIENTTLAKLMEGNSLSRIVDGRLFAWYRSGPCDRGEKLIGFHDGAPRILARRDYTTCGEHALDAEEIFNDSWMKLEGEPRR